MKSILVALAVISTLPLVAAEPIDVGSRRELFDTFIENFQFDDAVCGLQIDDKFELAAFLDRFQNPAVTQFAIDPDARSWMPLNLQDIDEIVGQIHRSKPR